MTKRYTIINKKAITTGKYECPCCGQASSVNTIEKRRMNTAYVEDHLNYMTSCIDCFEESEKIWGEMWADYWGSQF